MPHGSPTNGRDRPPEPGTPDQLAWTTDLHLDHVDAAGRAAFAAAVAEAAPDRLVVTG